MDATIGEVARSSGVTERTLRYYEELGLLTPRRDSGGRRRYDTEHVDRLYRIRLLRELGIGVGELDPDSADPLTLTSRHLADLDRRIGELTRQRERVRTVEERLMRGQAPTDAELVGVLTGMTDAETALTHRITLLVYADIAAAHRHLVEVFGFAPGKLAHDDTGVVVHGEVYAGDGAIWMHREAPEFGLSSPASLGAATHCMAVHVDDVDTYFAKVREADGEIAYEPINMPYGVREFGVRDPEGVLWSFMQPLPESSEATVDAVDAVDTVEGGASVP